MSVPDPVPLDQHRESEPATISPGAEWYTYDDVAAFFRMKRSTIYSWIRQGRIPSPTYFGSTARFSRDQFAEIAAGIDPPGTHTVGDSPRRTQGSKGGNPNVLKKKKRKKPTAKKPAAKKPTAKKRRVKP